MFYIFYRYFSNLSFVARCLLKDAVRSLLHSILPPATKRWGVGGRGVGIEEKSRPRPFYFQRMPFYQQGTPILPIANAHGLCLGM